MKLKSSFGVYTAIGLTTLASPHAEALQIVTVGQDSPHHVPEDVEADRILSERYAKSTEYIRMGRADMGSKEYIKAISSFKEAMKYSSAAYSDLAEAYIASGQNEDALQTYRDMLSSRGNSRVNDADVRMNYAILLHQAGRYREALLQYSEGLKSVPGGMQRDIPLDIKVNEQNVSSVQMLVGAHLAIAAYLAKEARYDDAARHCAEALRLKPNFALSYAYLGRTLLNSSPETHKAYGSAKSAFQKAADLGTGLVKQKAEEALGTGPAVVAQ